MNSQPALPFDMPAEPKAAEPENLMRISPNVDWFATALRWIVVAQGHDVTITPDGPVATKKGTS